MRPFETDLESWYKPKLRMKERLFSRWIVLRNLSNALEFCAVVLTSVLYLLAIIGCAVHHRQSVARTMLYLLVPRYLSHFIELFLVGKFLVTWDRDRTSRWSTRLYGDVRMNVWQRVSQVLLTPTVVTKSVPLTIGSVSFGLYHARGWTWAKWFGVTEYAEMGVRLAYTWILTFAGYPILGLLGVTKEDLSDLPEDMTNYSRVWSENNKNTWLARHKLKPRHEN